MNKCLFFNHVFTASCLLCDEDLYHTEVLCQACRDELPFIRHGCLYCGLPLASEGLCPDCQKQKPLFQPVTVPLVYSGSARYLLQQLKFSALLPVISLFAELIAERRSELSALPDILVPVPLHPARLQQRGFNQAHELAKCLSNRLSIANEYRLVKKVRHTAAQSELHSIRQRQANIRNCFQIDGKIKNLHVAIVDDVITTGTTMKELSRTLLDAGARQVEVLAVCRTVKKNSF